MLNVRSVLFIKSNWCSSENKNVGFVYWGPLLVAQKNFTDLKQEKQRKKDYGSAYLTATKFVQ